MTETTTNVNLIAVDFDPFAGPDIIRVVPITEPQAEIWTSCQLGGNDASRAFNESVSLRLNGPLNQAAFERAWQSLVHRHEALHSAFSADGRQMCVFRELSINLAYEDCSGKGATEQKGRITEVIKEDALHVFDLVNGPLLKAGLIRLSDTEHHFTLTAHHIICDGWSLGILLQDLSSLYSAYAQNHRPNLPVAPRFSDYAAEQLTVTKTKAFHEVERFWLDQYKGTVPVVNLPTDFPRPALRHFNSNRQDYAVDPALAQAVKNMGIKAGCSFVNTLMAAFEVFLHRLTGQSDIVLGLPAAGQSATGNERLVGHCVSLLPLRSFPQPDQTFLSFLQQRKAQLLDAYEHQQLTFGSLLKKLAIARDASRVPLVPVLFNVDLGLDDGVEFHGLQHQLISNPRQYETADLFLNIGGSVTSLTLEWSYNTLLFKDDTIERMMTEFESLLNEIVTNPAIRLDDISLADQRELLRKLATWNNTRADYPQNTPLHSLLDQTATQFPDKTALVFNGQQISYQLLSQSSNRLAHYLQRRGVGVGDVVGVVLERSPELIVALLAVMKAGAAYVPIDPDYPQDRIAFMLNDSSAGTVITSKKFAGRLAHRATEIEVEQALSEAVSCPKETPEVAVSGSDLAYILYTSGSTGRPKGVLIEHRNLVNLLYSMIAWPGMTNQDSLLAVTTVSFDIAGLELYLPLLVGATLVLADAETAKDGRALLETISEQRISVIQATPVTYKMMLAAGWEHPLPLKILCCGEPMSNELARQLTTRCDTLWNMYGPTETTIYSTGKQILATDEVITIGRPIQNTQVYILDEHLNPVPEGIIGEIYIAGDGVARGYLNRPELTNEKFVRNPFNVPGNRTMYRTGDLGLFTTTGEIHCLGRIDQQVKIRGYRVEPGEIEQELAKLDGVREALVLAREDRPGDQRLVAYVITQPLLTNLEFTNRIVPWQTQLQAVLPTYMVPSDFVSLAQFPVTPNGKIDRNALPKPNGERYVTSHNTQPVTEAEKQVAAIWAETLGLPNVGVHDDFFELGGHSMIAVQVMTQLEKQTGKRLPLSTLLTHPTVQKLARLLSQETPAITWKSLVPIKPQGNKMPIYIIHGIGLNLLNFSSLIAYMNPEQPIYGLQARGLDGSDEPLDNMEAIAATYVAEVLEQNPAGPYALAGYSFGGYVALEMARQLKAMGREVKMLAMFDTNAQESDMRQSKLSWISQKLFRQFPKLLWFTRSLILMPGPTIRYQKLYVDRQLQKLLTTVGLRQETPPESGFGLLDRIIEKHEIAYHNYVMKPYDGIIDLFKAQVRLYFVEDNKFLGWKKYALKGVRVHSVPGDHEMMLLPPNDKEFAHALQRALDNS